MDRGEIDPKARIGHRSADERSHVQIPARNVDDINALQRSEDVGAIYNAKRAMAAYRYITDPVRSKYLLDDTDYDMKVRVFERDAIGLIRANPDVTFDIYLPPYSILQWVALRETSPETLQSVYAFSAYFCSRLMEFPNVRLFDFRCKRRHARSGQLFRRDPPFACH